MLYEILVFCAFCSEAIYPEVVDSNEFPTFFRKEHSLVRPYQGRGMQVANWDYSGSALITKDFVRLTPDRQARRGCFHSFDSVYINCCPSLCICC